MHMKLNYLKRVLCVAVTVSMLGACFAGCGQANVVDALENVSEVTEAPSPEPTEEATPEPTEEATPEPTETPEPEPEPPEGMYFSELTGEPISLDLKDQRPVAVQVDNESLAYDHYGIAECDVVYEIMNSEKNGRITRLQCLRKDWQNIERMGSIRSIRTTNIWLAAEWNAICVHDGGPHYINKWIEKDYCDNLSGGFARIDNGKSREFTEYVTTGEIEKRLKAQNISPTYNEFKPERESHFLFVPYETETDLSEFGDKRKDVTTVSIPYEHTNSQLKYNEETKTYDYYCYGKQHLDGEDQEPLTFKNVFVQRASYLPYDDAGYIWFTIPDWMDIGYYCTNGKCVPVTWIKDGETGITKFYDSDKNEIKINRGKTYITLISYDRWDGLKLE